MMHAYSQQALAKFSLPMAAILALLNAPYAYANMASQAVQGVTVAGVDADANGVRDDVDSYIRRTFTAEGQRKAALQNARALQSALFTDLRDIVAVKAASSRVSYAVNCVFTRFTDATGDNNPAKVSSDIENLTVNTPERREVYEAYNKALSGTVSALPEHDTCE